MIESGMPALLASVAPAHPTFKPDDTGYPVISYILFSRVESESHDGPSGLVEYHYQFTMHAQTSAACRQMREDVIAKLRTVHDAYVGGVNITMVRITASRHIGHFPDWDAWQESVDAIFHVKE